MIQVMNNYVLRSALKIANAQTKAALLDMTDPAQMFQNSGETGAVGTNDPCGFLADLSIHGNNVLQATSGARPTFVSASGFPCLSFDGGDALLNNVTYCQGGAMTAVMALRLPNAGDRYVYAEGKSTDNDTIYAPFRTRSGSSMDVFIRTDSNNTRVDGSNIATAGSTDDAWHVVTFTDTSTQVRQRRDGGTFGSYNYVRSSAITPDRSAIGALHRAALSNYITGYIGRLFLCDAVLGDDDLRVIEKWAADPFGVALP